MFCMQTHPYSSMKTKHAGYIFVLFSSAEKKNADLETKLKVADKLVSVSTVTQVERL